MSNIIGQGVSFRGLYHDDFQYVFFIATGITAADQGKAVTIDTTAVNTVKLAGDNDRILGRLEVVEIRVQEGTSLGTVSLMGGLDFPPKAGYVAASGDNLVGAAGGLVQKAGADVTTNWMCFGEISAAGNPVGVKV